uniref:Fanconi anemia group F protein n=1 Tax=Jaculus jaculus TaxID=51337 RepID=UPI001E1B535A|nr:Fanconi anemia group F protein [Jaculus jaculus]
MEPLLQQVERFSEVLAVSGSVHVRSWDPPTVCRALQWARYLRHVSRRFGDHGRIREALERRLHGLARRQRHGALPVPALTSLEALGRCDVRLALRLLRNRALGPAACHALLRQLLPGAGAGAGADQDEDGPRQRLALLARRGCALHLLRLGGGAPGHADAHADGHADAPLRTQAELLLRRVREARRAQPEAPARLLGRLWERGPRVRLLSVAAAALLQPGADESVALVSWLLARAELTAAFCRLPADLLTAVSGRHPALARAYLGQLGAWGRQLHYDLPRGAWVAAEPRHVPWAELRRRFESLCGAPAPLKDAALAALRACKAQDGGFEVPGVSVWTDLLALLSA